LINSYLKPCVSKGISLLIIVLADDFDFVFIEDFREFCSLLFFFSNFFSWGLGAGLNEFVYTLDLDMSSFNDILL
jgi:hypothetical protein